MYLCSHFAINLIKLLKTLTLPKLVFWKPKCRKKHKFICKLNEGINYIFKILLVYSNENDSTVYCQK